MKLQPLSICLLTAVALPGCYLDLSSPHEPEADVWFVDAGGRLDAGRQDAGPQVDSGSEGSATRTNDLNISGVLLSGELGGVESGDDAYVYRASGREAYLSVDIRSRSEGGVVMNRLMIDRADLLAVGQSYEAPDGYDPDRVSVRVVGCSGPSDDLWSYDRSSDDVTMDVREGPEEGSVEIFYTVRFWNGDLLTGTTEGSFVLPRR